MNSITPDGATARGAATIYATLGWDVLPAWYPVWDGAAMRCACWHGADCATPGKHPVTSHRQDRHPRAYPARTVANLFSGPHPHNIAVLPGQRSGGLIVGDADRKHGGSRDTLLHAGWPAQTPTEETGGGGVHVYARWPFAGPVPILHDYLAGCEVLGDGSIVITAPSVHASARSYRWLPGLAPWEVEIAALPEAVAREITERAPAPSERALSASGYAVEDAAAHVYSADRTQELVAILLNSALRKVREGAHRNNTAYWLGRQLGSLRLTRAEIIAMMTLYERTVRDGE